MDIQAKIAVQLYSVRKEMERDLEGTLQKIHEIGFRYVQLDGMRGNVRQRFYAYFKNMS
ncbi:(truncated, N-terminal part) [Listeria innocua Clip11262]|uniref:(Truncated, N-terminal part) n=1 Tax=Listeria innocua serovar 6a (strain ATCC BAA-680 / CLIP 11262) TaxID=272626 RepID=Q92DD6_LISIN|nr:(truncated, N-terminal part) [Listeria innocua Clip11262]